MSTQVLHEIFKKVWEKESTLNNWKEGDFVKIAKKGDLANCHNERVNMHAFRNGKIPWQKYHLKAHDALENVLRV